MLRGSGRPARLRRHRDRAGSSSPPENRKQRSGQRIAKRIDGIDPGLNAEDRELEITKIEKEENKKGPQSAVAGFDFTFSVPKSVSVLWGVADAGTQALMVEAHHEAVAQGVAFLEREVAVTRAGAATRETEPSPSRASTTLDTYAHLWPTAEDRGPDASSRQSAHVCGSC